MTEQAIDCFCLLVPKGFPAAVFSRCFISSRPTSPGIFIALVIAAMLFVESTSMAQSRQPTLAPPQGLSEAPPWVAPNKKTEGPALTIGDDQETPVAEEILPAPIPQNNNGQPDSNEQSAGPASPLPTNHHPWGRFEPGAWRQLIIVSEIFDEDGVFVSQSETQRTETLVSRTNNQYTLRLETTITVSGKRIPGPTQEITYGLVTDSSKMASSIEIGKPTTISLQGQAIPCEQWLLTLPTDQGETVETIYYNADTFPHVLRRKRQETVKEEPVGERTTNIVRVGVPTVIDSTILSAYHTTTTQKSPTGPTTEQQGIHLQEVPGGLVSESETEFDAKGQRTRWTVTRLAAYGLEPEKSEAVATKPSDIKKAPPTEPEPTDIRPRRLLRMLRRSQRNASGLENSGSEPDPSQL